MNYQKELDTVIDAVVKSGTTPTLLLHSCCAPCSSYVLEYLSKYFSITLFYYNPNISPEDEYRHRVSEQKRLIEELPVKNKVSFVEGRYDHERYIEAVTGLENEKEGGKRCEKCFRLRMGEAVKYACEHNFDYFTTTLSISPHKNATLLNEIGTQLCKEEKVRFLPSDFKKREGYKHSIELSAEYGLYRQNYCGCIFSKAN